MGILTITNAEVLTLARLPLSGDAIATADVSAVIGYEGDAQEQRILPSALTNLALRPLLRRAVAKLIAAEVLEMRARDGSLAGFTGSGVTVSQPPEDYSRRLRADAEEELGPYLIPNPGSAKEIAEAARLTAQTAVIADESLADVAKATAETAKLTAETATIAARNTAEIAKLAAETSKIGAEAENLTTTVAITSARETQIRTTTTIAQLEAGLISRDEARIAISPGTSLVATAPIIYPNSPSSAGKDAQRRLFGRSEGER